LRIFKQGKTVNQYKSIIRRPYSSAKRINLKNISSSYPKLILNKKDQAHHFSKNIKRQIYFVSVRKRL
jgi:hypothetical protein